jgi:hypothetical protein
MRALHVILTEVRIPGLRRGRQVRDDESGECGRLYATALSASFARLRSVNQIAINESS